MFRYTGARALADELGSPDEIVPFLFFQGQSQEAVSGTGGLLARIKHVVGVGSVGAEGGTLHSHIQEESSASQVLRDTITEAVTGIEPAKASDGIPPSAVHAYLQAAAAKASTSHGALDMGATLISEDSQAPFSNRFLGSQFDDYRNIDSAMVVQASRLVARALAVMAIGDRADKAERLEECSTAVNSSLVEAW